MSLLENIKLQACRTSWTSVNKPTAQAAVKPSLGLLCGLFLSFYVCHAQPLDAQAFGDFTRMPNRTGVRPVVLSGAVEHFPKPSAGIKALLLSNVTEETAKALALYQHVVYLKVSAPLEPLDSATISLLADSIGSLPQLEDFEAEGVGDSGATLLKALQRRKNGLRALSIRGARLPVVSLDLLPEFAKLQFLDCRRWEIYDNEVPGGEVSDSRYRLAQIVARLAELDALMTDCSSPACIRMFEALPKLTTLALSDASDEAVEYVVTHMRLQSLSIAGSARATDECISFIAQSSTITALDVSGCDQIGSHGMDFWTTNSILQSLRISGSRQVNVYPSRQSRWKSVVPINPESESRLGRLGFEGISRCRNLKYLDVSDQCSVDDVCLQQLIKLQALQTLIFSFESLVTDQGFKTLAKMRSLKHLTLDHSHVGTSHMGAGTITDDACRYLSSSESIKYLHWRCVKLTDTGVQWIGTMRQLRRVELTCPISNSALPYLTKLNLELLAINGSALSDKGFAELSSCPTLRRLRVDGASQASDDSWKSLKSLKSLETLLCRWSGPSKAAYQELAENLPFCVISDDPTLQDDWLSDSLAN